MLYIYLSLGVIWTLTIISVYLHIKKKKYKTLWPIVASELCIVTIISVWMLSLQYKFEGVEGGSIWVLLIVGIMVFVNRRLKAPRYRSSKYSM